jgi:hypothetical protein
MLIGRKFCKSCKKQKDDNIPLDLQYSTFEEITDDFPFLDQTILNAIGFRRTSLMWKLDNSFYLDLSIEELYSTENEFGTPLILYCCNFEQNLNKLG